MRVIIQNESNHVLNRGVVVFHAGSNVASRWEDFQHFSEADQEFFDQLLPTEDINFDSSDELCIEPIQRASNKMDTLDIHSQSDIELEEIPLIENDSEAMDALRILKDKGFSVDQVTEEYRKLERVQVSKQRQRQAKKRSLDDKVRNSVGKILYEKGINGEGKDLDRNFLGKTNFVVLKSALDRHINKHAGRKSNERSEFTIQQLNEIDSNWDELISKAIQEVLGA